MTHNYVTGLSCFSDTAGKPRISDPIKLTGVDLSDPLNPVFSLICISHNGPPTTVTWTRDGQEVNYDDNHTLNRTVTDMFHSTYESVLTVKGSEPGRYQCCVANSRGRDCSQVYILEGKFFLLIKKL